LRCTEAARCLMSASSYSFNSVIPRAQSFIIVISASDNNTTVYNFKCHFVVFGVTLRLLVIHFVIVSRQKQSPSLTTAATSVINSPVCRGWVYCTSRSHAIEPGIGSESRFLPTSPAYDAPVTGGPRRNIAITFGMEKLEWCGYPTVKTFWRYVYSFWRKKGQTDGQTPHDG